MIELALIPHQNTKDWIDYLAAFAPLMAITVAVFVAIVQAQLQRQQLRQHLIDKRFDVYRSVGIFNEHLIYRGWVDNDDFLNLRSQFVNARYLFDSAVRRLMCETYSKAECYMVLLQEARSTQGVDLSNVTLTPELQELKTWLCDTAPRQVESSFNAYLQLQPEPLSVRCRDAKQFIDRWMEGKDKLRSRLRSGNPKSVISSGE